MDKIVYLYGSGRDSETRTLRHAAKPRQMVFRLGPWTVRPARSVPVEFPRLAPHKDELLHKISQGILQLRSGDDNVYTVVEINEAFAALVGTPDAPDYTTMPLAQLMELMRTERPTQEVWEAFVSRSLSSTDSDLPSIETRVHHLMDYSPRVAQLGLDTSATDLVLSEALAKVKADIEAEELVVKAAREAVKAQEEEQARAQAELEKQKADEEAARIEAQKAEDAKKPVVEETQEAPKVEETNEPPHDDAPPPSDADAPPHVEAEAGIPSKTSPEQMDFSKPEETTPVVEETKVEEAKVEEAKSDDVAEAKPSTGRTLPEGWRGLSNPKLKELITTSGAKMPDQVSKANLISALEAWLGGN